MLKITMEIDTENDAFDQCDCTNEVARILRDLAKRLQIQPKDVYNLQDTNGNHVGYCRIEEVKSNG